MSRQVYLIKRMINREHRKEKILSHYDKLGRLIPQDIYHELKSKKRCQRCKKFKNTPLQIHHKIPVSKGGESTKQNLMAVCKRCHEILDKEVLQWEI